MKNQYSQLSRILALLLSLTTACGPLANLGKRSSLHGVSHLAGADDDGDDDDDDEMNDIDQQIDAELGALEQQLRIGATPEADGPPIYTNIDDAGGVNIGTVTNVAYRPSSSSGETTDLSDDDYANTNSFPDLLNSLGMDIQQFDKSNSGLKSSGDSAHGATVPAPPQVTPADYPFKTPVGSDSGQRLAQAWQYEKAVKVFFNYRDPQLVQKQQMVGAADSSLHQADASFTSGDRPSGEFLLRLANDVLDAAMNPGASKWSTNTYMAFTGHDPGSNLTVSTFFQGSAMVSTAFVVGAECSAAGAVIAIGTEVALIAALVLTVNQIAEETDEIIKDAKDIAAAIDGDKDASTPTGSRGIDYRVQPGTNTPANIGGRDYTGHALDQMPGPSHVSCYDISTLKRYSSL